ncbi:hypothetical protein CANARDRAFT_28483 [[Candida] arabinofermentans NRRL YB-2248]|uniref:Malate dehydrogenase n=1 Tax=[Candida] arabinofermentans NRRL YB-2248 TaxID=983967 RepID=A0A1E4T0B3_9ASCO|nr:hypothetical protein CANARDRAFT_28483 [[Candida] arabinofermentans NRRL YB-2248]
MTKVTVLGAAGGIGQPLSLMLKLNPFIDDLALFDVVNVPGVATDLSHIDTNCKITHHLKSDNDGTGLATALKGSDFVIIPAGVPRKPGMTRDDLFKINAGICTDLAVGIAENCPNAFTLVISNPVNSTVPIFAEVYKKYGVFNARKLFGVTTLDCVRANTFMAEAAIGEAEPMDKLATSYNVRVVGGHSGETILPLYSVCAPHVYQLLPSEAVDALVHRVQYGGDEVVEAKNGAGSATLSMAYAGYKFLHAVLDAQDKTGIESTYIYLDESIPGAKETRQNLKNSCGADLDYFAMPVVLDKDGVKEIKHDILNRINDKERELLAICCKTLKGNIEKGVNFGK